MQPVLTAMRFPGGGGVGQGDSIHAHNAPPHRAEMRDESAKSKGTGGSSIKKSFKGHSPDPPTLVVKWMGTLSRDVTCYGAMFFKKITGRRII